MLPGHGQHFQIQRAGLSLPAWQNAAIPPSGCIDPFAWPPSTALMAMDTECTRCHNACCNRRALLQVAQRFSPALQQPMLLAVQQAVPRKLLISAGWSWRPLLLQWPADIINQGIIALIERILAVQGVAMSCKILC